MPGAFDFERSPEVLKQSIAMQSKFHWLNEPTVWSGDENALELSTEDKTDFWRETFYGFVRDNGHAFLCRVDGDFTASTIVFGSYEKLYDQAGLFLRIN